MESRGYNWLAGMQELIYFSADVWCEWKILPAYKPIYILLPACGK